MKSKKLNDSRQYILDKSKNVFIRKGFANVSMKDIVEECSISRGGLYHHFSSVAEIFADVLEQEACKHKVQDEKDDLNIFFENLKIRLINTDIALLRATIEYELTNISGNTEMLKIR